MKPYVEKRFFFHASAVALAAHIRRRDEFFISGVASSCLPATGGIARGESEGRSYRDLVSFDAASTSVFGDFTDRAKAVDYTYGNHGDNTLPTVTVAEGSISGFKIELGGRTFRAGHVEARMENFSDRVGAPRFHSLTAGFRGLSVDGVGLTVKTRCDIFSANDTKSRLRSTWEKDRKFRNTHGRHFFGAKPPAHSWFGGGRQEFPETRGLVYATVVSELGWERGEAPRGASIEGNRIRIENLGSIYVGEILIDDNSRRLTLLRFQLGSPHGGDGSAVDLQSNGTGWPPQVDGGN